MYKVQYICLVPCSNFILSQVQTNLSYYVKLSVLSVTFPHFSTTHPPHGLCAYRTVCIVMLLVIWPQPIMVQTLGGHVTGNTRRTQKRLIVTPHVVLAVGVGSCRTMKWHLNKFRQRSQTVANSFTRVKMYIRVQTWNHIHFKAEIKYHKTNCH